MSYSAHAIALMRLCIFPSFPPKSPGFTFQGSHQSCCGRLVSDVWQRMSVNCHCQVALALTDGMRMVQHSHGGALPLPDRWVAPQRRTREPRLPAAPPDQLLLWFRTSDSPQWVFGSLVCVHRMFRLTDIPSRELNRTSCGHELRHCRFGGKRRLLECDCDQKQAKHAHTIWCR